LGLGRTQVGLQFLQGKPFIININFSGQEPTAALAIKLREKNSLLVWTQRVQASVGKNIITEITGKTYIAKVLAIVQHGNNYISYKLQLIQRF